jgi:hypothetical protein
MRLTLVWRELWKTLIATAEAADFRYAIPLLLIAA